jgi:Rrf2 family nitric oxide-sensitive transcriptional repressor
VETTRGRGGGLRLLVAADQITVGEVLRRTETDFRLLECFDAKVNTCRLDGQCRLQCLLQGAMARFLETMDACTLADLLTPGVRGLCDAAAGSSQPVAPPTARSGRAAGSR